MHTLIPELPPLETLLERSFWNGEQPFRAVALRIMTSLDSNRVPFSGISAKSSTEPCWMSKVLAEPQECRIWR